MPIQGAVSGLVPVEVGPGCVRGAGVRAEVLECVRNALLGHHVAHTPVCWRALSSGALGWGGATSMGSACGSAGPGASGGEGISRLRSRREPGRPVAAQLRLTAERPGQPLGGTGGEAGGGKGGGGGGKGGGGGARGRGGGGWLAGWAGRVPVSHGLRRCRGGR